MLILLITGGIGSGKTTAGKILEKEGIKVIFADKLSRIATKASGKTLKKIRDTFGSEILFPDGNLNRKALAGIVFYNQKALRKLNRIIHPVVHRYVDEALKRYSEEEIVAIEDPILYFHRSLNGEKKTIFIDTLKKLRWLRLEKKGFSFPEILARQNSNPYDFEYRKASDETIKNNGTVKELASNLDNFLEKIGK